jgi:restriction system protein
VHADYRQLDLEILVLSMARGVVSVVLAVAREAARQQRLNEVAARRVQREEERRQRDYEREMRRLERERSLAWQRNERGRREIERQHKLAHIEAREQEVSDLNAVIADELRNLRSILAATLSVNDQINFDSLRIHETPPEFQPPPALASPLPPPSEEDLTSRVVAPKGMKALLPGATKRYEAEIAAAREDYKEALRRWQVKELERLQQLTNQEMEYARAVEIFQHKKAQRNAEVDEFERNYYAGEYDAIIAYYSMVLERSLYPKTFPQHFSIAYTAASKQLVVEYEFPAPSIVPSVSEYRYVKSSDTIVEKPAKASEISSIYQDVIAATTLRTIHEIIESDRGDHIEAVVFNGYVHTIDPATGRDIQPHLISVRTTKERFHKIDLSRVDKSVCLRNLGAQVSRQPTEATPVKPVVEFEMADARFIDQTDMISGLSSAMNLMELTPSEFETLVANLFGKMGLESKLTRSSRDGGVDCVAFDRRPILGGKVVIQAKRYKNTVGVSAVRDLYGTMQHEGANKGILVTTSGYGADAFDFVKDKPIELIDGGGLLFLLEEVGTHARIVFPEE